MGLPEVAFGILPDVGGTTRLTRLLGPHLAKLVILKGTLERADSHPLCGAMTQIVQGREALDGAVVELATALSRHPAPGVGLAKILIDRVAELPEADALRLEGAYQSILLARDDLSEHFMPALSFIREQFKGSKR